MHIIPRGQGKESQTVLWESNCEAGAVMPGLKPNLCVLHKTKTFRILSHHFLVYKAMEQEPYYNTYFT